MHLPRNERMLQSQALLGALSSTGLRRQVRAETL